MLYNIERSENPRLTLPLLEFVALMQVYYTAILCVLTLLYYTITHIY